jgi:2-hydroxy-3-keto-5-methylthiopentenyl-1-phosphate phosphatase
MDFDGAVSPADVSAELLRRFADPSWWDVEQELRERSIGLRETLVRQAALLEGSPDDWLGFAVSSFGLDPTFEPFVRWARSEGIALAVASDGFGFYIEPMLRAAGLDDVRVHANAFDPHTGALSFPSGHPVCVGCGTCKMNAVLRYRSLAGPTAFVGEGYSDRYGALYADLTFAKHHLAEICDDEGLASSPWSDFDDVRAGLIAVAAHGGAPGAPDPERCPGWTDPGAGTRA